jgi:hypothetical protein
MWCFSGAFDDELPADTSGTDRLELKCQLMREKSSPRQVEAVLNREEIEECRSSKRERLTLSIV